MPSRTPPSSGRIIERIPIPVIAFEKNEGSISSTFISRVIYRVPIRLKLREGGTISAVRYATRYWPIYEAKLFPEVTAQWVKSDDTLYGPNFSPLKLPLEHPFLFECDTPHGFYEW
jgi:hypothetical protein